MNWLNLDGIIGRRHLTEEDRERLAVKTIDSCVSVFTFPKRPVHGSVVDLFDGLFGIHLPDEFNAEITVMSPAVGSGFIADRRHIVTNSHVVEGDRASVHFRAAQGKSGIVIRQVMEAQVVARDVDNDLAILRVEHDMPFPALELKRGRARTNERVIAMKNPRVSGYLGSPAVVETFGAIVSTTGSHAPSHNVMRLRSGSVERGDSGSPVIDERGRAVGVMRSVNSEDATEGYAVPIEHVFPLLKKAKERKTN